MCAGYILPLLADYCARGNKIRIPEYMLPTTVEFDAWNFGTRLNEGTTVRIQSNPNIGFLGFLYKGSVRVTIRFL